MPLDHTAQQHEGSVGSLPWVSPQPQISIFPDWDQRAGLPRGLVGVWNVAGQGIRPLTAS